MTLNKEQRQALARIYARANLRHVPIGGGKFEFRQSQNQHFKPVTYLEFRRSVQSGYGCALVHWCGMWLGIEHDGYVHS